MPVADHANHSPAEPVSICSTRLVRSVTIDLSSLTSSRSDAADAPAGMSSATKTPNEGTADAQPSSHNALTAFAAVIGAIPYSSAIARCEGMRSPAFNWPDSILRR